MSGTVAKARVSNNVLVILVFLFLLVLVIFPLISVFTGSFSTGRPGVAGIFTFQNFIDIAKSDYWSIYVDTAVFAIGTTLASALIGVPLAVATARTNMPHRGAMEALAYVPLYFSPFIGAIAWSSLGAPRVGFLNQFFSLLGLPTVDIYTIPGMIWVAALYLSPYVFTFASGALKSMDASLEEASSMTGAGYTRTFLTVTFPLILPSVVAGLVLVFTMAVESFAIPAFLGSPSNIWLMASKIFWDMTALPTQYGTATAMAMVIMLCSSIGIFIHRRLLARGRRLVTVTGKGYRPTLHNLGSWKYPVFAACLAYFVISVVVPYAVLIYGSLQLYYTTSVGGAAIAPFTLNNYIYWFSYAPLAQALGNTIFLAVSGGAACIFAGLLICYVVYRTNARGRGLIDYIATFPIGVPGIVVGVAFLWAWISVPGLYATIWILLIAYVMRYIPYAVRSISSGLAQIGQDLEESAAVCGSSWFNILRKVVVPLLKPVMLGTWVLLFGLIARELSASVLLYTSGTEVVSVVIYHEFQDFALSGRVDALASLMAAFLMGVTYFSRRIWGKEIT